MNFSRKKLFYILFILLTCISILCVWYYHEQIDYDYSQLLLTPQKSIKSITSSSPLSQIHHVFIIVEENKDWRTIYQNPDAPFINTVLLKQGAFAQNYHNIVPGMGSLHPSEPSYILLESGQIAFPDNTFTSDNPPSASNNTSAEHITSLLEKKHLSWKAYEEDIPGTNCPIIAFGNYAPKHNPFIYFQDVSGNPPSTTNEYCQRHIRPFSELASDIQNNNLPNYVFITPNVQDDMHNGTIAQADEWLSHIVPLITNSVVFKKDGALFITWDEGSGSDSNNPIGMILVSPFVKKGYTNTTLYSHASYVKTLEEIFKLSPFLGFAGDKQTIDLSDFFTFH